MTWVMAIETGANGGRVHAYDVDKRQVPHPLGSRYEVVMEQPWTDPAPGPRCQHCLEIVGQYRSSGESDAAL